MKLILENLFEFKKGLDPIDSLGLGRRTLIEEWLKKMGVENYIINDDYTIDVNGDVILSQKHLFEFPEFIQFNEIEDFFTIQGNMFKSLRGSPKKCRGFSCSENKLTTLEGCPIKVIEDFYCYSNPGRFNHNDVYKLCEVGGIVYSSVF